MRITFQTSQSVNSHGVGVAAREGGNLGKDASQSDEDDQVIGAQRDYRDLRAQRAGESQTPSLPRGVWR